jgi:aryl-alcohol dehydrogenase-like predicted oxidoreductase
MQYEHLGRTGLVVSRLCLGTMNFGPIADEAASFQIMDRALELGVNFLDTADCYGSKDFEGETEQIIGRWLHREGGRRDKIVLASKVFVPMGHGANDRGLSAYHIRRACDDSLRRLGTDRIDLYYLHHIDRGAPTAADIPAWGLPDRDLRRPAHLPRFTPWEEIWQAMDVLVRQGKVLYVGTSNFAGWSIARACETASSRNLLGPICEESFYNLATRAAELEVLPACREYGLGAVAYSPLGRGLLAGMPDETHTGRRRFVRSLPPPERARLETYEAFCRELGESPANVALAWLLRNPVLTAPIIGPRTIGQLEDGVRAFDVELDDAALSRLDEIWPGPGGEAPEAYAW